MSKGYKKIWCVIGLPCSGKSTAAKILAKALGGSTYISTGDIARELSVNSKELWATTEKNDQFPLEDKLRFELNVKIATAPTANVIIDGFPRFKEQAEYLIDKLWEYIPTVIEVNAGDQSTLMWRARNRARDSRDTNDFEFAQRMATASKNLTGALEVLNSRLGQTHTLMSGDFTYMTNTINKIIKGKL